MDLFPDPKRLTSCGELNPQLYDLSALFILLAQNALDFKKS